MARIMVVEGDSALAESLSEVLRQAGHKVVTVPDGLVALETLGTDEFDLLLAEAEMPELDGIALALKVDKDFPGTRILMLSGSQPHLTHNLKALVHGILEKPFTFDQIRRCVEEALKAAPP